MPTGNLDRATAQEILALINQLSVSHETSFIVVTHDEDLARSMDRVVQLTDGQLNGVSTEETLDEH